MQSDSMPWSWLGLTLIVSYHHCDSMLTGGSFAFTCQNTTAGSHKNRRLLFYCSSPEQSKAKRFIKTRLESDLWSPANTFTKSDERLVWRASSSPAVSRHLQNTECQQGQVYPRDRWNSIIVRIKTAGLMCAVPALGSSGHTTNQEVNLLNLLLINKLVVGKQILWGFIYWSKLPEMFWYLTSSLCIADCFIQHMRAEFCPFIFHKV